MTEFSSKILSTFNNEKAIALFKKYPLDGFKAQISYQEDCDDCEYELSIQLTLFDGDIKYTDFHRKMSTGIRRMLDKCMEILIDSFVEIVFDNDEERKILLNDPSFIEMISEIFTETYQKYLLKEPKRVELIYVLAAMFHSYNGVLSDEEISYLYHLLTNIDENTSDFLKEMEGWFERENKCD